MSEPASGTQPDRRLGAIVLTAAVPGTRAWTRNPLPTRLLGGAGDHACPVRAGGRRSSQLAAEYATAMLATIDGGLGGVFYTGIAPHEWHGRNPRAQPREEANALISDALRRTLAEPAPADFRLDLPVTQGRRMPTVNIDSNATLEEYLDHVEQRRAVS